MEHHSTNKKCITNVHIQSIGSNTDNYLLMLICISVGEKNDYLAKIQMWKWLLDLQLWPLFAESLGSLPCFSETLFFSSYCSKCTLKIFASPVQQLLCFTAMHSNAAVIQSFLKAPFPSQLVVTTVLHSVGVGVSYCLPLYSCTG